MSNYQELKQYIPSNDALLGRVILITGANRGIGKSIALSCAQHGAEVILAGKNLSELEKTYDAILALHPKYQPSILGINLLTATWGDYQLVAQNITEKHGRLDGLLHNAAVLGQQAPIANYNVDSWYQAIQINLNAAFLLTKALLPNLKKSTQGSLLFTTADPAYCPQAYSGAYAVSKAGLQCLMEILNVELADNTKIRVNCVNPGKVRTQLRAAMFPGESPNASTQPELLQAIYIYLLSTQNSCSGKTINCQKILTAECCAT